jgi:hypothetical protein
MPSQALLLKFGAARLRQFQAGLLEAIHRKWVGTEGNFVWVTRNGQVAVR